jgi:chemotaxis protein MotB
MARRHKHEEHANHEAWAIPYGDLVTLLLAFFVVMYALSSVNEGKYRVLSDSLQAAFRGTPQTMEPVQVGHKQVGSGADLKVSLVQQSVLAGQPRALLAPVPADNRELPSGNIAVGLPQEPKDPQATALANSLVRVADNVENAMQDLIQKNLVVVRRRGVWVEVEIRTDILFASGVATLPPSAQEILGRLADTLKPFPNPVRVEGHTDNRPINTVAFPSNWELSAARAASVVHLFSKRGIDPSRLMVVGFGEQHPAQANDSPEGRNANRRVLLLIMGNDKMPEPDTIQSMTQQLPARGQVLQ